VELASFGLTLGLSLIYRYAMSRELVAWRASIVGAPRRGPQPVSPPGSAPSMSSRSPTSRHYGSVSRGRLLIWLMVGERRLLRRGAGYGTGDRSQARPVVMIEDKRGETPIALRHQKADAAPSASPSRSRRSRPRGEMGTSIWPSGHRPAAAP